MKKHYLFSTLLLMSLFVSSFAQDWVEMMNDPKVNFYKIQKAFNTYYQKAERQMEKEKRKMSRMQGVNMSDEEMEVPGFAQYKRWEWFMEPRVSANGDRFAPDVVWQAMEKYRKDNAVTTTAGNWTSLGPVNTANLYGAGRLTFVRVHPTDPNTIFVGTAAGGLWVSTNGGTIWTTKTDLMAQVIGCSDLAFDPTNPNIMYLLTGDKDHGDTYSVGLLKSTDGGNTWNVTGLSFNVSQTGRMRKLLVDPSNKNNIIVAGSTGIYRSSDAGATFTQTSTVGIFDMLFKPGASATVYACGTDFYRSTDGGATWTQITSGLPAGSTLCRLAIAVTPADPNLIYLAAGKAKPYGLQGFYSSTDGGTTFSNLSNPTNGTQQWYDLCIAANPSNAKEIMFGQQTSFQKSTDGGVNWAQIATSTHVDYHEIMYTNGTTAYLGSDGGIWKTTDNGSSWTKLNNNLVISQMYGFGQSTTTANLLLQGWQDNGTILRNAAGTWQNAMGGDGMLAFISWNNEKTMWGSQYSGSLNYNLNGAGWKSYAAISETCPWVTQWREDPVTAGTVYAGCVNVWKSINGAAFTQTGTVSTSTVGVTALRVSPANNQVMWTAKGSALYKSVNGGSAWTAIASGGIPTSGKITCIECHPTNANKAWVTFSGYIGTNKVFQTTDQGTTWTDVASASLPNIPVNCIRLDKNGNDALYIGTDAGVYYKDASMNSWMSFSGGLPNVVVTQLEIFYTGSKIRASTFGRGMWESDLYSNPNSITDHSNCIVDCINLFPNPNSGVFWISVPPGQFTNGSSSKINTDVYNTMGEKIYSASSMPAASKNEIDLSKYGKGIYFIKVQSADKVYSEKVIVQ